MTLTDWWRIYKPLPPFNVLTFHSDNPIHITSIMAHSTCVFFYDHKASEYFDGKNLIFYQVVIKENILSQSGSPKESM
jgi:hypothetical protein